MFYKSKPQKRREASAEVDAGQDVKGMEVWLSTLSSKLASHNYASLKYLLECGFGYVFISFLAN